MKRRKFVTTSASIALAPWALTDVPTNQSATKAVAGELYDLKTFELKFGGNHQALMDYLEKVHNPFLHSLGAKTMMFKETGASEPAKLWTLTAYPNLSSYQKSFLLESHPEVLIKSKKYIEAGVTYNRISSSLLLAFASIPQMKDPIEGAGLFELRIYEGLNEDAVRRKIKMFDHEELDLFYRTDMNPIFFGKMLVGPYIPSLVYMLNFRDMEHRQQAWDTFLNHEEWNRMKVKPEYANSVSNIRKIFLKPV